MILKHRKGSIPLLLGILLALVLSAFTLRPNYFSEYNNELFSYWMTLDPGFSDAGNMKQFFARASGRIPEITSGQLTGFDERPPIERLDIDIKFSDMQAIFKDRERALKNQILSKPTKVPAEIRFRNKTLKAKIRLKGDLIDHWKARTRMSFRVTLKGNNAIFGFKSLSIHKPKARQHPYDQIYQSLRRKLGNLSASHTYARVYVNGVDWGVMNIEEHMSKELLEKRGYKESIIVRFGDEKSWVYSRSFGDRKRSLAGYRLSDATLNVKLYGAEKYLKKDIYRKWFSYIAEQRLKADSSLLYDVNKFSQTLMLTEVWNNRHSLSHSNTRYYFSPYTLKIEPITTDQGSFRPWTKGRGGSKFDPMKYKLYQEIVSTDEYEAKFHKNLKAVKKIVATAENDINYYHSFFPLDKKPSGKVLKNNMREVWRNPDTYLPKNYERKIRKPGFPRVKNISEEDAGFFPDHIYARHFMDGSIDIFNLIPGKVDIVSINFKGKPILSLDKELAPYTPRDYRPGVTITTSLTGVRDGKVSVVTEFMGHRRELELPISHYRNGLFNPLLDPTAEAFEFISVLDSNSFRISKGKWWVDTPIRVDGNLVVPAGVEIYFSEGAYLLVNGAIDVRGTEEEHVVFKAQNNNWKGIYVYGANSSSQLKNLVIENTRSLEDGLLNLTGGVTFYESDVSLKNVVFDGTIAEDALNIVNSKFTLDQVTIKSTVSDGIDCDFSDGTVKYSLFDEIGGDALDFSGSKVQIKHSEVINVHDKAVSVGEASSVTVENSFMDNVGVAIASKDGSEATMSNVEVASFTLHTAMTYIKKSFYDDPVLELINNQVKGTPSYSRQQGTRLYVDGRLIAEEDVNVRDLYNQGVMKK